MDTNEANIVDYIYLRRTNIAWKACSEGYLLSPVKNLIRLDSLVLSVTRFQELRN